MKAVADARKIKGKYKIIEHTADIGITMEAETLAELFALSAFPMRIIATASLNAVSLLSKTPQVKVKT